MVETKSKNDILLEEKVAKIDDINFDKIYDVSEFATKQIEDFNKDNEDLSIDEIVKADDFLMPKEESLFEVEVQPNDFLDNLVFNKDDEVSTNIEKEKFNISNKPLFFTFTSIAVLLCILFIYNVFVINSLKAKSTVIASSANVSTVVEEENNFISFENSSKIEIKENKNYVEESQTTNNWFETVLSYLDKLFGGSY